MTKLIAQRFDTEAEGSFRLYGKMLGFLAAWEQAEVSKDTAKQVQAMQQLEALVKPMLATDDETPVDDALDKLSFAGFFALVIAVFSVKKEEPVPPESEPS